MRQRKWAIQLMFIIIVLISISGCKSSPKITWNPGQDYAYINVSRANEIKSLTIKDSGEMSIQHHLLNEGKSFTITIELEDIHELFDYIVNENDFYRLKNLRMADDDYNNPEINEKINVTLDGKRHTLSHAGFITEEVFGNIRNKIYKIADKYIDIDTFMKNEHMLP